MKRVISVIILIFSFSCSAFSQSKEKAFDDMVTSHVKGTIPLINAEELKKKIENKERVILLDAREKKEFAISRLRNAVWVGYSDFSTSRIKNIAKNEQVIVYCSIGYRSEKIGEKLKKAGYTKVYNLYGGIFDWVNSGHPVYDAGAAPTKRVHAYDKNWGIWLFNSEKIYE